MAEVKGHNERKMIEEGEDDNCDEDMVTALCYSSLSTVLGRVVKLQVA